MTETPRSGAAALQYGELPEFARTLRAMGSARRSAGERQSHFFLALIDARRKANDAADALTRVRSFDASELLRALERAIERILVDWPDKRPSARRALRAELNERVTRYSTAIVRLGECAVVVLSAKGEAGEAAWRAWIAQLAAVFDEADRAWIAIQSVVDALPVASPPQR